MGRTAAIIITIAALCLEGSVGARTFDGPKVNGDGPAPNVNGDGNATQTRKTRRRRSRRRRTVAHPSTVNGNSGPASQPAHMAPQPEDVPPVKPRSTPTPPKPDIRNPGQNPPGE